MISKLESYCQFHFDKAECYEHSWQTHGGWRTFCSWIFCK